jgi:hypothetical protein
MSQTVWPTKKNQQCVLSSKKDKVFTSILLGSFDNKCLKRYSKKGGGDQQNTTPQPINTLCFTKNNSPEDAVTNMLTDMPAPAFSLMMEKLPLKEQTKIVYLSKTLLSALEHKSKQLKTDPSIYVPMITEQISDLITCNYSFEVTFVPTKRQKNFGNFVTMTVTEKELILNFHNESYINTIKTHFPNHVIEKDLFSEDDEIESNQSQESTVTKSSKSPSPYVNDGDYPMYSKAQAWDWQYEPKYTYTVRFNHMKKTKSATKVIITDLSKVLNMVFDLLQKHHLRLIHNKEEKIMTYSLKNNTGKYYYHNTREKSFPLTEINKFEAIKKKFIKVCSYFDVFQKVVNQKHKENK